VIKGIGNDTPLSFVSFNTDHSMCFTTTSLTISKYGSVISSHDWFYKRETSFIINTSLLGISIINHIVSEISCGFFGCTRRMQDDLIQRFVNFNAYCWAILLFFWVHWSAPYHNLNTFTWCCWGLYCRHCLLDLLCRELNLLNLNFINYLTIKYYL